MLASQLRLEAPSPTTRFQLYSTKLNIQSFAMSSQVSIGQIVLDFHHFPA